MSAGPEELQSIKGIGREMTRAIVGFFSNERNREVIGKLIGRGLTIQPVEPSMPMESSLSGRKFCFTGTLKSMTQPEAKKRVEDRGGEVVSSVSSRLDYLVAGEEPGSKLDKAKSLGVRILDESAFLEMIGEE